MLLRSEREYRLWIEESDKQVWHHAVDRRAAMQFRAMCGWEIDARHGRVWPQKPGEAGPPDDRRCNSCVGQDRPRWDE